MRGQGDEGLNKERLEIQYRHDHHPQQKSYVEGQSLGVQDGNADIQIDMLLLVTQQGTTKGCPTAAGPQAKPRLYGGLRVLV